MSTRSLRPIGRVFVDTSAYFAFADSRDDNHASARAIATRIALEKSHLFTTNFVVAETHALLLNRIGHDLATAFLDQTNRSTATIVRVNLNDERCAREIIIRYGDKDFTLTDATSFAVMERLAISFAFTFDHHFTQYGFIAVTVPQP